MKLLAGVAAQLQTGERQFSVGVRVTLRNLTSRCVVQAETGALKRRFRIRVHFADLYTGFPQRIGARCGDIQCRSCNSDRVLGAVHHISGRCADFLIAVAAQREVGKDRLTVCAGNRVGDFVASTVKQPIGNACQGFTGISVYLVDGQGPIFFHSTYLKVNVSNYGVRNLCQRSTRLVVTAIGRFQQDSLIAIYIQRVTVITADIAVQLRSSRLCSGHRQSVAALCDIHTADIASKTKLWKCAVRVCDGSTILTAVPCQLNCICIRELTLVLYGKTGNGSM